MSTSYTVNIEKRAGKTVAEFVRKRILIRHAVPMLRRGRFLTGAFDEELGVKDVSWLTPGGAAIA